MSSQGTMILGMFLDPCQKQRLKYRGGGYFVQRAPPKDRLCTSGKVRGEVELWKPKMCVMTSAVL